MDETTERAQLPAAPSMGNLIFAIAAGVFFGGIALAIAAWIVLFVDNLPR